MSRFGAIKSDRAARAVAKEADPEPVAESQGTRPVARIGKKVVSGYFSVEMRRELHLLGLEQDKSLQSLMGEAFDDLFRKYGKHPFGER